MIIDLPSPNFDERGDQDIDMLVLHYTGMKNSQAAKERLCDASAKVSAHYLVEENGEIFRLVPEEKRAWHAGLSYWRGHRNINQRSIGIEIVNPGHEFGYRPFPPAQMEAVAWLCADILARNRIPARNVVAHSDIAPTRKDDPGELFDWPWLAANGIGLFPAELVDPGESDKMLANFGYHMVSPSHAILAFQRRFRPHALTGEWDTECAMLLAGLLKLV